MSDIESFNKVLVFVAYKRMADRLFDEMEWYFQVNAV